jgi:hypothetical protein
LYFDSGSLATLLLCAMSTQMTLLNTILSDVHVKHTFLDVPTPKMALRQYSVSAPASFCDDGDCADLRDVSESSSSGDSKEEKEEGGLSDASTHASTYVWGELEPKIKSVHGSTFSWGDIEPSEAGSSGEQEEDKEEIVAEEKTCEPCAVEVCSCGEEFIPGAKFCVCCGKPRQAESTPATSDGAEDLSTLIKQSLKRKSANQRTALSSKAQSWSPKVQMVNSVFDVQMANIKTNIEMALANNAIMASVQTQKGLSGFTVFISSDQGDKESETVLCIAQQAILRALCVAQQQATLRAAEQSSCVYLLGYENMPFKRVPKGFIATLAEMGNETMACWDLFARGECASGSECHLGHPASQACLMVQLVQ